MKHHYYYKYRAGRISRIKWLIIGAIAYHYWNGHKERVIQTQGGYGGCHFKLLDYEKKEKPKIKKIEIKETKYSREAEKAIRELTEAIEAIKEKYEIATGEEQF
mmetsp:Transcript_5422/g.8001  ORF Transcript_5422/g.8001 Transcript_5422/m.8001 type:complete len:104 (-) Transcript_5422:24-335(-)